MEDPERVPHWIRPNEACRVPRRNIFLHTVASTRRTKAGSTRSWGVAAATFRATPRGRKHSSSSQVFTQSGDLWAAVCAFTLEGARTVLWAHNLGVTLRVADGLQSMSRLGWELLAHNLAAHGTWLIWGKGKARLTMVDLGAVYPKLLPEIGKAFGLGIRSGNAKSETLAHAVGRCQDGETIVRTAATAYLDWIETAGLGNWQLTGAGQSYAALRHRHLTHSMLVHADTGALEMERAAMWTGRCEAYWHGTLTREVVHEWDFRMSYPSICAERTLPTKLVGIMPDRYPWRRHLDDDRVAFVAEVTVDTPAPVVPARHDGRILWPVGRFDTTLWDVEIAEAIRAGATVVVHGGYLYRKTPALKSWARWVIGMLSPGRDEAPPWQQMIVRHWSTACIGRFGMMYPRWDSLGRTPKSAVDRRVCIDVDTGEQYDIMQVGHELFRQGPMVEWQHSMPAITGYVMAVARVKLWQLLAAMPPRMALYADTDSILVPDGCEPVMAALAATEAGRGLRLKRSWDGFAIYGPRQLVTGKRVRVSGVPVAAEQIAPQTFAGEVWESLAVSIGAKRPDRIVTRDRVWHAKGVDRRRKGPAFGWTEPYELGAHA